MAKLILILTILFNNVGHAIDSQYLSKLSQIFNSEYKSIAFDVRNPRGGNGDVAASYLTIMDLLTRWQFKGKITLIANHETLPIINKISKNNRIFQKRVHIEDFSRREFSTEAYDLLLVLASDNGAISRSDIGRYEYNSEKKYWKNVIHVKFDGVVLVQTVLGDTESGNLRPTGIIETRGMQFLTNVAGVSDSQAGSYTDYVALGLRDKSEAEIDTFIFDESSKIEEQHWRNAIRALTLGKIIPNARLGLVYGITLSQTKRQFEDYLLSLLSHYNNSEEKIILVTPSNFKREDIKDRYVRSQIRKIELSELYASNLNSIKEKVIILETPILPHSVFVGLMAKSYYQGIIPLGSGDGFMSGAIDLGRPFVLTKVEWNRANINALAKSLSRSVRKNKSPAELAAINSLLKNIHNYGQLDRTYELFKHEDLYRNLRDSVPELSERIINTLVNLRAAFRSPRTIEQTISQSTDASFRYSLYHQREELQKERELLRSSEIDFTLDIPEQHVSFADLDLFERFFYRAKQVLEVIKELILVAIENDMEEVLNSESRRRQQATNMCAKLFT